MRAVHAASPPLCCSASPRAPSSVTWYPGCGECSHLSEEPRLLASQVGRAVMRCLGKPWMVPSARAGPEPCLNQGTSQPTGHTVTAPFLSEEARCQVVAEVTCLRRARVSAACLCSLVCCIVFSCQESRELGSFPVAQGRERHTAGVRPIDTCWMDGWLIWSFLLAASTLRAGTAYCLSL